MNRKELKKSFDEGLIDAEKYKEALFQLELNKEVRSQKPQTLPKSIKAEEFKLLISKIPKGNKYNKIRIAFLLSYESGLRISEVAALNKENFQGNQINVIGGKGGKDRAVPLPKTWKPWMLNHIPIRITTKSSCVRSLQRFFSRFSHRANLSNDYSFHSLRHGFATRLIEKGMPINHLQFLLGHADMETTSIYTKARPVDALKSYEEFF